MKKVHSTLFTVKYTAQHGQKSNQNDSSNVELANKYSFEGPLIQLLRWEKSHDSSGFKLIWGQSAPAENVLLKKSYAAQWLSPRLRQITMEREFYSL